MRKHISFILLFVTLSLILCAQPIAEVRLGGNIKNYGHTLKSSANETWVLWNDSSTYGYDIYGQKYDSLGNAAFAAPIPIVTSNSSVKLTDAVATSDNGFVLTFMQEDEADQRQVSLYLQKINSQGLPQWTDSGIMIAPIIGSNIKFKNTKLCANNLGAAFLTYLNEDNISSFANYDAAGNNIWTATSTIDSIQFSDIDQVLLTDAGHMIINIHYTNGTNYIRKVDNNGNTVGNFPMFAPDAVLPESPSLKKAANGNFLIYSEHFHETQALTLQMMDANGNLVYDTLKQLDMGQSSYWTTRLKISPLSDGGFILAYGSVGNYHSQPNELRVQRLNATLDPVWGSVNPLIFTGDSPIFDYDLAVDSSDHAWLSTLRATVDFRLMQIEMVKLNSDGIPAFPSQVVGTATEKKWSPKYSLLADKAMLFWSDHVDDQISMRKQVFTASGDPLFPQTGAPIASKLAGEAEVYGVYSLSNRTVCLMHDTRRNQRQIYYQILDNDMNQYLAENGQALFPSDELSQYVLAAKVSPQNKLVIVYRKRDAALSEIYLQEIDAEGNLTYPSAGHLLAPVLAQATAAIAFGDDSCYIYWIHNLNVYNSRGIIKGQKIVNGAPVWAEGGIELYNILEKSVSKVEAEGRYLIFKCRDTTDSRYELRAMYILPTGSFNPAWDAEGRPLFDSIHNLEPSSDFQIGVIQDDLYCLAQTSNHNHEFFLRAQKLDATGNILWGDDGLIICYSDQLMPILYTSIFTDQIDILYRLLWHGTFLQKIDTEGNFGFEEHGISMTACQTAQLVKYANDSYSYFWIDDDISYGRRLMHRYINSGGSFQESQVLSTANIFDLYPVNCDNNAAIYWSQNNTDYLSIEESGIGSSIYATALAQPIANQDITQEPVPMVSLHQNTPNPFTGSTRISYKLLEAAPVKIQIFNIKGQLVHELQSMSKAAGEYFMDWDGTDLRGQKCAGGIYLYKITAAAHSASKKMVLLK